MLFREASLMLRYRFLDRGPGRQSRFCRKIALLPPTRMVNVAPFSRSWLSIKIQYMQIISIPCVRLLAWVVQPPHRNAMKADPRLLTCVKLHRTAKTEGRRLYTFERARPSVWGSFEQVPSLESELVSALPLQGTCADAPPCPENIAVRQPASTRTRAGIFGDGTDGKPARKCCQVFPGKELSHAPIKLLPCLESRRYPIKGADLLAGM